MKIGTGTVSREDALKFADEMETAIGEVVNGTRKIAKLPIEPISRLIQFARDKAAPIPEGKRERIAFYEEAMKDPKNHGALALELAFLRNKDDERTTAEKAAAKAAA